LKDALREVAFIKGKDCIAGIDDVKWGENFRYENLDGHDWKVEFRWDWGIMGYHDRRYGDTDGKQLIVDTMKKVT
jgi:hypothetical protein